MSKHSTPKSLGKKGMGKNDFVKMQPQMQTVLRVVNMQCQCEGCCSKIRSVLKKIKGVKSCKIDLEQGKVTVIGDVDPAKLIEKLSQKTDKHVELWGFPKGMNMNMNMNNLNNQMKNIHGGIGGGMNPSHKKGDDMMNLNQMFSKANLNGKGGPPQLKDTKMMMPPSKDQKSVKFQMPEDEYDTTDDEFDDDDDESFDDESDDEHDVRHGDFGKPKSVGGGKKGFSLSNVPLLKRLGSKKEDKKSENEGGNKKGDEFHDKKQSGGKNNSKKGSHSPQQLKPDGKNGGKGHGGNNGGGGGDGGGGGGGGKNMKEGHKDHGGQAMNKLGPDLARNMGQTGRNMGQGQMGYGPMGGQMGNFQSTQGLPMASMPLGGPQYPQGMALGYNNPYVNQQQQYMAAMMNQQQQQQYQNGMYNNNNPMMMYGRPMSYGPPPTPPHAMDNHFTNYFNDENTNSCSIM